MRTITLERPVNTSIWYYRVDFNIRISAEPRPNNWFIFPSSVVYNGTEYTKAIIPQQDYKTLESVLGQRI